MLKTSEKACITAVILAGGRGRRMGGRDKGLMQVAGQPLVAFVGDQVAPQVGDLLVSANRNYAEYQRLGCRVIRDELEDYQGPLAGFASAMRASEREWLLCLPCDAPRPAGDLAERLFRAALAAQVDIAVAHDGVRIQPVHVLLKRMLLPDLERFLASGERKIDRWYANHRVVEVDFSDRRSSFENMNTPEEKAELERELARHA